MTLQELQNQALQLPAGDRWQLVQAVLDSLRQDSKSQQQAPETQVANSRFEQNFGKLELADALALDNESLDADLAVEYANAHEIG